MKYNIKQDDKTLRRNLYVEIRDLFNNRKYKAVIKVATKFIDMYSSETNVIFMRAKAYRNLEMFDESIKDLKYILTYINKDNEFALTELFYLYYYLNMYKEAIELLPVLYKNGSINAYSLSIAEIIMKNSLGMDTDNCAKHSKHLDYIKNQILSYTDEALLNHINVHVESDEESNKAFFKENINLKYLIEVVKENLKTSKKINTEEMFELHYFGISNIGYDKSNYNSYDCIKVVVVPNTSNIITMYPVNDEFITYATPLIYDYGKMFGEEKQKVKSISQIEKFNRKFKR